MDYEGFSSEREYLIGLKYEALRINQEARQAVRRAKILYILSGIQFGCCVLILAFNGA